MANHSPNEDNYVSKKSWDEAMSGDAAKASDTSKDAAKRASDKGAAAKNGGGDK